MARRAAVRIDGLDELIRRLRHTEHGMDDFKALNARIGDMVGHYAMGAAPIRTGTLATSMRSSGTKRTAIVRFGGARVPYANPIHWGWQSRPNAARGWRGGPINANPWASRAARQSEPRWVASYRDAIERLLDGR
ncbi:hypothetical protein AB0J38_00160 [Streptomyces sp. NPDC050095]|uniref:hypothetical protein n=1 Tax=unclassified Streptomyces TaxID=2593676 RepID=UPI00343BD661